MFINGGDFNAFFYYMHWIPSFHWLQVIKKIVIPSSVVSIGDYAFYECTTLVDVEFPSSLVSIGKHAFCDCLSLSNIAIPTSVTSLGKYSFCGCSSLKKALIPSHINIQNIGISSIKI